MSKSKSKKQEGLPISDAHKPIKAKRHQHFEKEKKKYKIRQCIQPHVIKEYHYRVSISTHEAEGRGFLRRALYRNLGKYLKRGANACADAGGTIIDIPHMYHEADRVQFPADFMKTKSEKKPKTDKKDDEKKTESGSGSGSGSSTTEATVSEKSLESSSSDKKSKKSKKGSKKEQPAAEEEKKE